MKNILIDETGNRYGRLLVVERAPNGKSRGVYWQCRCDCGGLTVVLGASLRAGNTQSCGCIGRVSLSQATKAKRAKKRGETFAKHGLRLIDWDPDNDEEREW